MPPIPTALDAEALSLIESIQRHYNDLSTFQIPRLRACPGPLVTHQAWAAEVREDIEGLARQIEELDVLVDDQRAERAKRELRTKVTLFRDSLANIRKDSRAALLASKHAIDAQSRSQREELLRSPAIREKSTSTSGEKVTEDALMKANHDVTEALQRTIGLMQKELERSVLSSQLLESSTATLQSASTTHDTLDLILGTSKQLITALEKTDWLDRILIISGLVFFGLVVVFILTQRIVHRGLRIAFFWTRLLPSSSSNTLAVVQKAGEVVASASASTAAASTMLASLIAGQDGGAAELIEPMDASESPSFTIPTMESRTTGQHTGSGDVHVEL
ncbi:Sec20-domain-containing protein [Suillus ampliporus]|nr:Sec20-domain-containing protein [Suillus ampliporus]